MIVAAWAILCILVAVTSENLLNATAKHDQEAEAEQEVKTEQRSEVQLNKLFQHADKDGSKRRTHEVAWRWSWAPTRISSSRRPRTSGTGTRVGRSSWSGSRSSAA